MIPVRDGRRRSGSSNGRGKSRSHYGPGSRCERPSPRDSRADPAEQLRTIFVEQVGRELVDRHGDDRAWAAARAERLRGRQCRDGEGSASDASPFPSAPASCTPIWSPSFATQDSLSQLRPQPLVDHAAGWPCPASPSSSGRRRSRTAPPCQPYTAATLSALAARTSSISASIAPVSLVCLSPRSRRSRRRRRRFRA